jgi:SAM-dependent methyltransferase
VLEQIYTTGEYLEKNPTWHVDESPWKAREVSRMLTRNRLAPKTICEVGCGAGEILRLMQQCMSHECMFWGYEISPQAYALCKTKANERLHFKLGDIHQEQGVSYDLILIMDVLEHLEDYFSFLRQVQPKSQYKIIQLPLDISARSVLLGQINHYRQAYGHLHYFTKELALQMLRDMNYEVLDYAYTRNSLAVPWHRLRQDPKAVVKRLLGNMRRSVTSLPAWLIFRVNRDIAERIFGGWRLLILVK